jgi:hypothetical protein
VDPNSVLAARKAGKPANDDGPDFDVGVERSSGGGEDEGGSDSCSGCTSAGMRRPGGRGEWVDSPQSEKVT